MMGTAKHTCPGCGHAVAGQSKFCRRCGAAVSPVAKENEPQTETDLTPSRIVPTPGAPEPPARGASSMPPGPAGVEERATRSRSVLLGVGLLVLVLIAGGFAALRFGRDDQPTSAGMARDTRDGGQPDQTAPGVRPDDSSSAESDGRRGNAGKVTYTAYTPSSDAYTTEIPVGREWSAPSESEPTPGERFTTTIQGPNGLVVMIDYTPNQAATFGADFTSKRQIARSSFDAVTEYVFSGGGLRQCEGSTCFDYVLNATPAGPGYAIVAGGGPDPALAKAVARHLADELVSGAAAPASPAAEAQGGFVTCDGSPAQVTVQVENVRCQDAAKVYQAYDQQCLGGTPQRLNCTVQRFACLYRSQISATRCTDGGRVVRFNVLD